MASLGPLLGPPRRGTKKGSERRPHGATFPVAVAPHQRRPRPAIGVTRLLAGLTTPPSPVRARPSLANRAPRPVAPVRVQAFAVRLTPLKAPGAAPRVAARLATVVAQPTAATREHVAGCRHRSRPFDWPPTTTAPPGAVAAAPRTAPTGVSGPVCVAQLVAVPPVVVRQARARRS